MRTKLQPDLCLNQPGLLWAMPRHVTVERRCHFRQRSLHARGCDWLGSHRTCKARTHHLKNDTPYLKSATTNYTQPELNWRTIHFKVTYPSSLQCITQLQKSCFFNPACRWSAIFSGVKQDTELSFWQIWGQNIHIESVRYETVINYVWAANLNTEQSASRSKEGKTILTQ